MRRVLRVWLFALCLGGLGPPACIDLKPDVGKLHKSGTTGDPVDPADGGDSNGNDNNGGSSENGGPNGNANDSGGSNGNGANTGNGNTGNDNTGSDNGATANASSDGQNDAGMMKPDAGPDNGCATKDSNPERGVSFGQDVWPILAGCGCHNTADADPFAILESGLTIDGYSSLRKGGDNSKALIIVDGNPCKSLLLDKLGEAPSFGDRMPQDGPYLSEPQRRLISDWIAEGARDN